MRRRRRTYATMCRWRMTPRVEAPLGARSDTDDDDDDDDDDVRWIDILYNYN